jgi:spore photoproduct lyase
LTKSVDPEAEGRFQRRLSEPEFAESLPWPAEAIAPIAPAGYPSLRAGDLAAVRHRGSFIRPCPATPRYNCCGLNIVHIGQGCDFGCSYCVLSAYLGSEAVIVFGNAATDGLMELSERLDAMAAGTFSPPPGASAPSHRFCTGEFTDSLILGDRLGLTAKLVELFRDRPPFTLEIKTKTGKLDGLLDLGHGGRTVISFSVNAPEISAKEEPLAAPLLSRLDAAARAAAKGWRIGLHLDPLVYHPGWERGYEALAKLVAERLDPESIAWVSMGCLRYPPALKPIMLRKRPSALFDAEFVRGGDGKMRYPRPLRTLMYREVAGFLAPALGPRTIVYLCMESGRVWREAMGSDPGTEGLTAMFQGPLP